MKSVERRLSYAPHAGHVFDAAVITTLIYLMHRLLADPWAIEWYFAFFVLFALLAPISYFHEVESVTETDAPDPSER